MKRIIEKKAILFLTAVLLSIASFAQNQVGFPSSNERGVAQIEGLAVYPNPIADKLQISGLPENGTAQLINLLGIQVLAIKSTARTEEVDVSALNPGIYFLKVFDNNGNYEVRRLLKE